MRSLIILIVCCLGAPDSLADVYRWLDKNGNYEYSDELPDDVADYEIIEPDQLPHIHRMQKPQHIRTYKSTSRTKASPRRTSSGKSHDCKLYQQKEEYYNTQLREGYAEPRGNYLRSKRRQWRELIGKHCIF